MNAIIALISFLAGFLLHKAIVREDLKLAGMVKKLVGAKVAAAKLAEAKVKSEVAKIGAEVKVEEKKF